MEFDSALQVFSYQNFNALVAMPDAELISRVKDLLAASIASSEPVNFDKLLSTGITIARTQKLGVDKAVIDWMHAEPTARRVDAGCGLLSGLWHPQFFQGPVDASSLMVLVQLWQVAVQDDDAACSFVFAIFQASKAKMTADLREALRAILTTIQAHPASAGCQQIIGAQLSDIAAAVNPG